MRVLASSDSLNTDSLSRLKLEDWFLPEILDDFEKNCANRLPNAPLGGIFERSFDIRREVKLSLSERMDPRVLDFYYRRWKYISQVETAKERRTRIPCRFGGVSSYRSVVIVLNLVR